MALDPVVNFFQSEIATLPVASGGTSIVISSGDGAKLPDPAVDGAYNLTIYEEGNPFSLPEIVRVTTRSSDTLTVTRAQEGTTATTKTAGTTWKVVMFPTAKTIQDIDTAKLDVAGGTMTGNLTIPDKIIHSGDTNTAIRFPANDTFTVETGGVERLRLDDNSVIINTNLTSKNYQIAQGDAVILLSKWGVSERNSVRIFAQDTGARNKLIVDIVSEGSDSTLVATIMSTEGHVVNDIRKQRVTYEGEDYLALGLYRNIAGTFSSRLYYAFGSINANFRVVEAGDVSVVTDFGIANEAWVHNYSNVSIFGNVGIGTTSPATKLDVNGAIRTSTGILFGADTAAANTLDDYEEGTFTMTMAPSAGFTATSNTVTARYTKIGNVVVVTGLPKMTIPASLGTYVNNSTSFFVNVSGLPFNIASNIQDRSAPVIGIATNLGVTSGYLAGAGSNNTDSMTIFVNKDDGSVRTSPNLTVSTEANFHIQFTYRTA